MSRFAGNPDQNVAYSVGDLIIFLYICTPYGPYESKYGSPSWTSQGKYVINIWEDAEKSKISHYMPREQQIGQFQISKTVAVASTS